MQNRLLFLFAFRKQSLKNNGEFILMLSKLSKPKLIVQVTLLTVLLVFSGLLVLGSFDVADWAEASHGSSHHGNELYFGISLNKWLNLHLGGENYYNQP